MKKIIASALALCMLMICASGAFAAEIGDEVIVGAEGLTEVSGVWYSSQNDTGIHYNNNGKYVSGSGEAKISGIIPESGCYELFWYYSGHSADTGMCTVNFECENGPQEQKFSVSGSRGWVSLGKYDYSAGENSVVLKINGQSRFSGLKWKYVGINVTVSSKKYTINNGIKCIANIPFGTGVEEFLENIVPMDNMSLKVTDIDGNEKIGMLEDGDRLIAEYEGEILEYYLKTFAEGVRYSDNFNYKDYEEYKKIQSAFNSSENANEYMNEDIITPEIVEYNSSRAISFEPKKVNLTSQQPRINFIYFKELGEKAVIEYDVTQRNMPKGSAWIDVGAEFSGVPKRPDGRGYAIWSANLNGRGTLMRDSSAAARWLSFEEKPLEMESERTYHVRQMIDFNGNIETYIDGIQAKVTDEKLTQEVSKSMAGFEAVNGLGIGIYLEIKDWTKQSGEASAVFDNIKVYDPVEYAEYLINRLPEKNQAAGSDIKERTELARNTIDELTEIGLSEDEISNIDKLEYWEEQLNGAEISSEIYSVEDKTISGIIAGQTVGEVFKYIIFPEGSEYEIVGKNNEDTVQSGDILKVGNIFGETVEFELIADKDIAVLDYAFSQDTISDIPYATAVRDFLANIIYPEAAQAGIYTGDSENNSQVLDGDILKIILNGTEKTYNLSVVPVSEDNYILSAGSFEVSENTVSNIPYGTLFQELKSAITVSQYASVSYPYADDYEGFVSDGDMIKVTAQNGAERIYTLIVNPGKNTSELTATGNIKVDAEKKVISGADKGMAVSELLESLKASNGGTIKIYSKEQTEITSGTITGTETVRVFPEDPVPGRNFDVYVLSCNENLISGEAVIVTIEDEGFSFTGEKLISGGAVEPGYNGITTVYINGGSAFFRPQIPESGDYDVYVYTSYHSSNKECPGVITYNGGSADVVIPQNQQSGWKLLGRYNFLEGSEGFIECRNSEGGGFGRYSAVKFEKCGEVIDIKDARVVSEDASFGLHEGVNDVYCKGASIEFSSEADITAEDIFIISENGNETEFVFSAENGVYRITPEYALKDDVAYYVHINSEAVSKPYTYVLNKTRAGLEANAQISFFDKNSVIVSGAENAVSAQVKTELLNMGKEEASARVLVCYYPEPGVMESYIEENISLPAGETLKINKQIDIKTASAKGKVKVFIWDENLIPIGDVYYK